MAGDGPLRQNGEGGRKPSQLHPPRRPPLRQRPHPHRPRPQQDPQGHRHQEPAHAGLLCSLCAGLGLPRAAHRTDGRQETRQQEARPLQGRVPQAVPRLRQRVGKDPEQGVPAPRRARRMGRSLSDHENPLRGGHRPRTGPLRRAGRPLQGQEAGPLVLLLRDRPGRGRGRICRPHLAVDLRQVPLRRRAARPAAVAARQKALLRHLDHHPLDDSRQPRNLPQPGAALRGRGSRRRGAGAGRRALPAGHEGARHRGLPGAGHLRGGDLRQEYLPPPLL